MWKYCSRGSAYTPIVVEDKDGNLFEGYMNIESRYVNKNESSFVNATQDLQNRLSDDLFNTTIDERIDKYLSFYVSYLDEEIIPS